MCSWNLHGCAYDELTEYFRHFDPRHKREKEIFTKLGYIDIKNLVSRIRAEVLLFTGLNDMACPPKSQFAVYNNMTCKKHHFLYPEFGHENLYDSSNITLSFFCGGNYLMSESAER